MPPCPAPYLIDWLFEIGPTASAGMGLAPISWHDIAAWSEATGIVAQPWEARLLRRLSGDYVSALQDGEKETAPAPWVSREGAERNRKAVADGLGRQFRAMVMAGGRTPGRKGIGER